MRERRWIYLIALVVLLGIAWPGGHLPVADRVVELLLVGLVAYVVFRQPAVRGVLKGLPTHARVLGATLAVAVYVGHAVGAPEHTFPFVDWTMYSTPPDERVRTYTFRGTTAEGRFVDIVPSARDPRLRTSLAPFALHNQAERAQRDIEQGRPPRELEHLRANLLALARLHNARPGVVRPVVRVTVSSHTLPTGAVSGEAEHRLVWEFGVQ